MFVNGHDSGGSFEFLGVPCVAKEPADNMQASIPRVIIEVELHRRVRCKASHGSVVQRCDATVETLPEVSPLEEGDQFVAVCPRHCTESTEGNVYGLGVYAPGSTLCTAAVHAGICDAASPMCEILVTIGGPKNFFQTASGHSIVSKVHGPSDASIRLSKAPCLVPSPKKVKYAVTFGETTGPEVSQFTAFP